MHDLVDRLHRRDATVVILGQGYVGLLLAMAASEAGFTVVGVEPDVARATALAKGSSYVDDVPDAALQTALDHGYRVVSAAEDIPAFDVAVVAVPTGLTDGRPELGPLQEASGWAGAALTPGALVVLESTTYPGTTRELLVPTLEAASGLTCGTDFLAGYSPERINPGDQRFSLRTTPKVVAGLDRAAATAIAAFYGAFVDTLVPMARPEEAELTKLLENTFRHVNIALVNELAVFAHDLGVDLRAAIAAASTKPFGYEAFHPGPGVGGHCLPVDPSYLSWRVERELGAPFRFVELANEVNARMPSYVVQRIHEMLNRDGLAMRGSRVVVLGLAYKPATSDIREAPSLSIIAGLQRLGAHVVAADPHVDPSVHDLDVQLVSADAETLSSCDLAVLVTDHPTFDLDLLVREAPRVLDTRGVISVGAAGRAVVEQL